MIKVCVGLLEDVMFTVYTLGEYLRYWKRNHEPYLTPNRILKGENDSEAKYRTSFCKPTIHENGEYYQKIDYMNILSTMIYKIYSMFPVH